MILQHFYERARRAHYHTSFVPEKRAESIVRDYSEELQHDLDSIPEDAREQYQNNYEKYLGNWLAAKSNCISSMITGGSNFPVARAQKWNKREQGHWEKFREWRDRAKRAIERKGKVKATPVTDLEEAVKNLAQREADQKRMIAANKIVRSKIDGSIDDDEYIVSMAPIGIPAAAAIKLLEPDFAGRRGFADYQLTNNSSEIRRLKDRIEMLQNKVEKSEQSEDERTFAFTGGACVLNYGIDRIQLLFDGKPDDETRQKLKSNGWNWSPSNAAWQRKITGNAVWSLGRVTDVDTKLVIENIRQ